MVSHHEYERNSHIRCGMRLEDELISLGTVLMDAVFSMLLYSYASHFSHTFNAKVDPK